MKQVYLDDLKLHDLDDATCPFYIEIPIKGLEFPSLRVNSSARAGEDGININGIYLGERRIQMTGKVYDNASGFNHIALRKEFLANCAPIRDANNLLTPRILRFTDIAGNAYRAVVQVVSATMDFDQVRHSTFYIDLLADIEVIESYAEKSGTIAPYQGGGFVLPAILPIAFEAGTGGTVIITNAGDSKALPIITLSGTLTNPRISNLTTGKSLALSHTIASGESIVINMRQHTIVQGGVTNRIDKKTSDSAWFWLAPGPNILQLTTSASGENGTAYVVIRDAWVGV